MIKDIPKTDDPVRLAEFKKRRIREKLANKVKQQVYKNRNISQIIKDLMDVHRAKENNCPRLAQMLDEVSKSKLEAMQAVKFEYYDEENPGKISYHKVLQKFFGRTVPRNFECAYDFKAVLQELIDDLNEELKRQRKTRNLARIFGSQRELEDVIFFKGFDR